MHSAVPLMFTLCVLVILAFITPKLEAYTPVVYPTINNVTSLLSYSITKNSDDTRHQWNINCPTSTKVLFIFEIFEMYSAEVQVSQNNNGVDDIIFKCASCGALIPPQFESQMPSVSIVAFGVVDGNALTPSRFTVRFVNKLPISNPALLSLAFKYNMGYAHIVPVLLSNGKLPARTVQTWTINIQNGATSNNIKFALADLLFSAPGCVSKLTIYDSDDPSVRKQLYTGCASTDLIDNWLYSTTGKAYVVLDNSALNQDSFTSFRLTYLGDKGLFNCGSMNNVVDVLTETTAFLSDGSLPTFNNAGAMRYSMDCKWLIQPTEGIVTDTITLVFNWVSLKQGSQVVVYDSHNTSGAVLWDSGQQYYQGGYQGRSVTAPPPIVSSSKSLFVHYKSDGSEDNNYYGFYGEYFLNKPQSKGMGSRMTSLAMSSAVDINLPGKQDTYATNFNYKYVIAPDRIIPGSKITFAINAINLPNAEDTLIIYDGNAVNSSRIVVQLSGMTTPPLTWFQTKSDKALMVLSSQADSTNTGSLRLNYFSDGPNYHCGFTRNPVSLTAPSMALFDGSISNGAIYQAQDCQWVIEPPQSSGIFLFFLYFGVMGGALEIFNDEFDPTWGRYDLQSHRVAIIGNTLAVPSPMFLPYARVGFRYTTNGAPSGNGFRAYYFRQSSIRTIGSVPGDGIIRLFSSSMLNLGNNDRDDYIPPNLNLVYSIKPLQPDLPYIYFSFASMNLTSGHARLKLYDGASTSSPLIGTYYGANIASFSKTWIRTSSAQATLEFVSDGTVGNYGNFELSYYSSGPNSHCGFNVNPGRLKSQSMVFTDGSAASESMYRGQSCQWIIQPELSLNNYQTDGLLVLELLLSDLRGGGLEIYKGTSQIADNLLWRCVECQTLPRLLISDEGSMFVRFWTTSSSAATMGAGFKAVYWSTTAAVEAEWTQFNKAEGKVLEAPLGIVIPANNDNETVAWHLGLGNDLDGISAGEPGSIVYSPRIISSVSQSTTQTASKVRDGRSSSWPEFQATLTSTPLTCGMLSSNHTTMLSKENFGIRAMQWAGAYITSRAIGVGIHNSRGSFDTTISNSVNAQVKPASVCKYILDTGSTQSISISGKHLVGNSRLRIWGGKWGNDAVLYDSNNAAQYPPSLLLNGVVAPCGRSLILLELNETLAISANHGLNLRFVANAEATEGNTCNLYYISLLPKIIEKDPWIPYYIAMGALFGLCILFFFCMYLRKLSHKYYPENGCNPFKRIRIYRVVTPRHLAFTPRWDAFRNKFLGKGECVICQDKCKVFTLKPCNHKLCPEDLAGYLGAALGDISLFPVKCPLHFEGCTSTISDHIAKRVLDAVQFAKFNEFSDRSKYGEGMRCIFCNNYVNFPEEGKFSMVECPYCIQTFCIRCKKPWHFTSKCPLDGIDDSLDKWKKESGAAKCPACSKLIEKSDIETCNHMVHKITDGIPCIKDRTDFCYCCGEEVMPDYPHDEVKRPGVNHFPDGVYQKCRLIMQRERDSERDRLKRLRRMKNSNGAKREMSFTGLEIASDGRVAVDDDGWEKVPEYLLAEHREGRGAEARLGDAFDQQWDTEMAKARVTAKSELGDDSEEEEEEVVDLGQTVPSKQGQRSPTPSAPSTSPAITRNSGQVARSSQANSTPMREPQRTSLQQQGQRSSTPQQSYRQQPQQLQQQQQQQQQRNRASPAPKAVTPAQSPARRGTQRISPAS